MVSQRRYQYVNYVCPPGDGISGQLPIAVDRGLPAHPDRPLGVRDTEVCGREIPQPTHVCWHTHREAEVTFQSQTQRVHFTFIQYVKFSIFIYY